MAESTAGIYLAYNKGPQLFVSKCGKAYEADPDEPSLNCNRASGWSDAASIMGDVASFDAEGNATILSSKPEFKNDPAAELDLAAWDNMLVLSYPTNNDAIRVATCYTGGAGCADARGWYSTVVEPDGTQERAAPKLLVSPGQDKKFAHPNLAVTQNYMYLSWKRSGQLNGTDDLTYLVRCERGPWMLSDSSCPGTTDYSSLILWPSNEGAEPASMFRGSGKPTRSGGTVNLPG